MKVGQKSDCPLELQARLFDRLKPQYEFVTQFFGGQVPKKWVQRMEGA